MSSMGHRRGRGWSSVTSGEGTGTPTALRRPGTATVSQKPKYSAIVDDIRNFPTDNSSREVPAEKIRQVIESMKKVAAEENLTDLAGRLYDEAVADREFGAKYAMLFGHEDFMKIYGSTGSMRSLLLSAMQRDFERKEEMKEASMTQFRNAISLLAQAYHNMKTFSGSRLRIFELPLIEYLNMLLELATEEDIKFIGTQMAHHGQNVYSNNIGTKDAVPDGLSQKTLEALEQLIMNVRRALVSKDLSSGSRAMLLFIVELAGQRYNQLPGDLQEFYTTECPCKNLSPVKCHDKTTRATRKKRAGNDHNVDKESTDLQMHRPRDDTSGKNNATAETEIIAQRTGKMIIDKKGNSPCGTIVPRAIRGSGAGGDSRQEQKSHSVRKSCNVYKQKSNSFKEAWGHDDRFDCDYE